MQMVKKEDVGHTHVACFGELGLRVPVRINVEDSGTAARLEVMEGTSDKLLRAGTPLGHATLDILEAPSTVLTYINGATTQALLAADMIVPAGATEINGSGVIQGIVYLNKTPIAIVADAKAALKNCIFRKISDRG